MNLSLFSQAAHWLGRNAEALILGALIAAMLVLIMLGLRALGHRMLQRDPHCRTLKGVIGGVFAKTTLLFMVATALETVARYADMPARPEHLLYALFTIAAALQAAIWAREFVLGVIHRHVGETPGGAGLDNATSVIRVLVSVVFFGLALVAILGNLGVDVTALVAGLGIGGIGIGLAAQGIFGDLFAALSILFDGPFRRGDTIRYDSTTGTVERIGLKTTRLRAGSGEQVIMANTKLLEREIHNLADANRRRQVLTFGLVYHLSPERLDRATALAQQVVEGTEGCHFIHCTLTGLAPSSVDFELLWDDDSLDPNVNAERRSAVILGVLRAFAAEKLDFAYPTQTSFTAAPDGSFVLPYAAGLGGTAAC